MLQKRARLYRNLAIQIIHRASRRNQPPDRFRKTEGAVALRTTILGTACVLALGLATAGSAVANPSDFAGVLSAGFSHSSSDVEGDSIRSNDWTFAGSAVVNTNWLNGMNVQGDASFDSASLKFDGEGIHSDKTVLNVSPFWRFDWGRAGIVLGYNRADYYGEVSPSATNYGIYGE